MIVLGSNVRDTDTGFSGIAAGRMIWLYGHGSTRVCIFDQIVYEWFDEQQVEVIHGPQPLPVVV